jgi:23S rRNA pseudouridine1911/1915/1917 synthase
VPPKPAASYAPEAIPVSVLHEDDDCLVVDKPAGLVVHPAPGHPSGTLVNALLALRPQVAGVGSERKAGIVHRLDRDTSGCLLVAKHDRAHEILSRQFAERSVEKRYWAWTWGHMVGESGEIDRPIGRSTSDRQRMSSRTRRGRSAVTRWRVLERYPVGEWLELAPETGRTHQIRVHLAEAGHPVIGDGRYGGGPTRARGFHGPQRPLAEWAAAAAARQALHARSLAFDGPSDGRRIRVEAPLPADLARLQEALREAG